MVTGMDRPPTPDLVADTLAWIEGRLDERLTLARLADRAGLSPYHFSRLFTARMGLAPMAHVRARRLVRAARRLAAEPGLRLAVADSPDFELYDGRFAPNRPGTVIDGHVPVVA